jgi:hypothetical protein
MKRKNGPLFWGGFFITIGTLVLLTKYDILLSSWDFIWGLYPIIFVFIGVLIISKNTVFKPIASLTFGIFMATLIFGSINYFIGDVNFNWDSKDYSYSYYNEEFKEDYKYANLDFKGGAGYFLIDSYTDDLVSAKSSGVLGDYRFDINDSYDKVYVSFEQRGKHILFFNDDVRSRLRIKLNPAPLWDFNLDFGAAKADFDLTNYRIKDLDIETGLSDVSLKLGNQYHDTHIKVSMGAASLKIEYPKSSGCRISGDMVLFDKDLNGLHNMRRNDNNSYVSDNFEEAENRIYITIDGGVSKLKIRTY